MSGYKQRTEAERAAIDERARNWKRPPAALSPIQCEALGFMLQGELTGTRKGYRLPPSDRYVRSQTILSLQQRGLCSISGRGLKCRARITPAGRREIAR